MALLSKPGFPQYKNQNGYQRKEGNKDEECHNQEVTICPILLKPWWNRALEEKADNVIAHQSQNNDRH